MRYAELLTERSRMQPVTMFHGTALSKVRSILKHGLLPSERADPSIEHRRWATLGGVYLTADFDHAVMIAKQADVPIAVIVAQVSPKSGTPDEDIVEKALILSFTSALDAWGIDDAYEADLDQFADHEAQRPKDDWGDDEAEPFDREKFFREFWQTVVANMAQKAGKPHGDPGGIIQSAVEMALAIQDDESSVEMTRWQDIKERLLKLYPKLRLPAQHAQANLAMPHNVRLTKPLGYAGRNRIIAILVPDDDDGMKLDYDWKAVYGTVPVGVIGGSK